MLDALATALCTAVDTGVGRTYAGLAIFWAHDLHTLVYFINSTK